MKLHAVGNDASIDGLGLKNLKRRFQAINRDRLQRVRDSLQERQRVFLDLLPLMFHINHPMLPGYLCNSTPAGVSGYSPGRQTIEAARRLSRTFTYRQRALPRYDILALYLMGSGGTIAYSRHSDFDVWVCVRPECSEEQRDALQRKAEGIESWASSLGLEVHFFIMNDTGFRNGELAALSADSSGSTQHHLLLDEFYRTGLLVAGRYPVWWLVPPEAEHDYERHVHDLIHRRFIDGDEVLDFGGLGGLPAGEFFGAALWQLFKAVDSPYKSVLKILLMEAYAGAYPQVDLLALRYKRAIHEGTADLNRIDPYALIEDSVEEYLSDRGEQERLELARRCLYFKAGIPLSGNGRAVADDWRREAMQHLVENWGWDQGHLAMLDCHSHWKIDQVIEERDALVDALTRSYRALSTFARKHAGSIAIDPTELHLLGRRLYSAFERKAGKVEIINPGFDMDPMEERLSLHRVRSAEQDGWLLYRGHVNPAGAQHHTPLKRARSLLELLAWCHFNHLLHPVTTVFSLYPEDCGVSPWELRSIVDSLDQLFPDAAPPASALEELAEPPRISCGGLFINVGLDPMHSLTRQGMELLTNRTDALNYGSRWENLALSFDLIVASTWQEVLTFRHSGDNALLDCLCDYLAWYPFSGGEIPPAVAGYSFSSTRGAAIARRVEELFHDVIDCFYRSAEGRSARYVLQAGNVHYLLQGDNDILRYQRLSSRNGLLDHLGTAQEDFSPVAIDRHTLQDTPLPLIFAASRAGVVQLFYQVLGDHAHVYVIDERGSLFHQQVAFHDNLTLLTQFQRFLESVRFRMDLPAPWGGAMAGHDIEYRQIIAAGCGFRLQARELDPARLSSSYFDIQVIGDITGDGRTTFTMYCNQQEFSSIEYGDRLFEAVARYVLGRRAGGQTYPIYITDIDLARGLIDVEAPGGLQTVHFLNYKKRIENRLNQALADV